MLPLNDELGAGAGVSSYTHWAGGEPSNTQHAADAAKGTVAGDEDCVYVHGGRYLPAEKRMQWGDHPCAEKLNAVCEVPAKFRYTFHRTIDNDDEEDDDAEMAQEPQEQHPMLMTWLEAEKFCQSSYAGGHLADIQTEAENRRVFHMCPAQRCWIGLSDRQKEGDFAWADGTKLGTAGRAGHAGLTRWAPNEPNNGGAGGKAENCVYVHGTEYETPYKRQSQWGDHPCAEKMAFVCQVPIVPLPTLKKQMAKSSSSAEADPVKPPAQGLFEVFFELLLRGIGEEAFARLRERFVRVLARDVLVFDRVSLKDITCAVRAAPPLLRARLGSGGDLPAATHLLVIVRVDEAGDADRIQRDLRRWTTPSNAHELATLLEAEGGMPAAVQALRAKVSVGKKGQAFPQAGWKMADVLRQAGPAGAALRDSGAGGIGGGGGGGGGGIAPLQAVLMTLLLAGGVALAFVAAVRRGLIDEATLQDWRREAHEVAGRGYTNARRWAAHVRGKRRGRYANLVQHESALLEEAPVASAPAVSTEPSAVGAGPGPAPTASATAAPQIHDEL